MSEFPGEPGGVEWLKAEGRASDVVMSSRVRLARNIAGLPFPNAASRDQKLEALSIVRTHAFRREVADGLLWVDLNDAGSLDRALLVERHLISKQMSKGSDPRAAILSSPDERLSIMVNEEDHLRIQCMRSGFALRETYEQVDAIDDRIEERLDYAFSPRWGYLTACATNVGTGIRVSVMLHLPGLRLTGEIEKVRRAFKGMNLAVRGFYGEGSEAAGDFFQLSNQTTLGKEESTLLEEFEGAIVPQVIEYERQARDSLLKKRRVMLEDRSHRALAILRNARLLGSDEALTLLSQVRLGLRLGLVDGVDPAIVNILVLLTQPAHLQRTLGVEMDQAERRIARADLVRARLGGTSHS